MYDSIDLAELKRMADLAEAEPKLNMARWRCGTSGCLVGTWCMNSPGDDLRLTCDGYGFSSCPVFGEYKYEDAAAVRFGLPFSVSSFLFVSNPGYLSVDAMDLDKQGAIARLRKYIRYVERKRALWAEHDWLMSLSRRDRLARLNEKRRELVTVAIMCFDSPKGTVMTWTRELADALRSAAAKIQNGDTYDWYSTADCNCGALAQELCGIKSAELRQLVHGIGAWSEACFCDRTGEPVSAIFARLVESGMSHQDISDLEFLGNPEVHAASGNQGFIEGHSFGRYLVHDERPMYNEASNVIRYMLAWADMIDEQLGLRDPVPVEVVPERELAVVKGE